MLSYCCFLYPTTVTKYSEGGDSVLGDHPSLKVRVSLAWNLMDKTLIKPFALHGGDRVSSARGSLLGCLSPSRPLTAAAHCLSVGLSACASSVSTSHRMIDGNLKRGKPGWLLLRRHLDERINKVIKRTCKLSRTAKPQTRGKVEAWKKKGEKHSLKGVCPLIDRQCDNKPPRARFTLGLSPRQQGFSCTRTFAKVRALVAQPKRALLRQDAHSSHMMSI